MYQWKKNGINAGTNSSTFTDNNLVTGDSVTCTLTSNNSCVTTNSANSNGIKIIVNTPVTPAVSISESVNNICSGTPVTFSASITNGGASPKYQWKKNGINAGTNSSTYTDYALNNGDKITCVLTSDLSCITSNNISSNTIQMNVNLLLTPSVIITASATSICPGKSVTFNATLTNGGNAPMYQWKKNNINTGVNSSVYTDYSMLNNDVVTCTITSNGTCLVYPLAVSNSVSINVFKNPVVNLDHTSTLCSGSSRLLDAGSFASYLWNDGTTGRYFSVKNTGTYYVSVNDNNGCIGGDTTTISNLLALPSAFLPADTAVCSYGSISINAKTGYNQYLWSTNSPAVSITVNLPGIYWLDVTDNNNCKGRDSILVSSKQCLQGFYIPNAFTPNSDGRNDVFKPFLFGNMRQYNFTVYNRFGQKIFTTIEINKGWDGTIKGILQNTNVFIWVCSYQLQNEPVKIERGTVTLIR